MKNTIILHKNISKPENLIINPLVLYSKLTLEVKIIFKDNKGKSGIYRWNNLITRASYIGSAIDLTRRFRDYFSLVFLKKKLLKIIV